jgi:hypothetical protein
MRDQDNNERFGMIMAAAVAAVSIVAIVLFDFALGTGAQRDGPSMISAAAIERAGASVVVTGALGESHPRQEAENSGPVGH